MTLLSGRGCERAVTNEAPDGLIWVVRDWTRCSDAQLLASSCTEAAAFAEFYRRYEASVLGFFMRRTREGEVAAELGAEVFAQALAGAHRYRPVGPTAAGWLFAIAQNVLLKSVRRGRVEDASRRRLGMALHLQLSDASRERLDIMAASQSWVEELLDRLPPAQRDAVRAHVIDDRTYKDIASSSVASEAVIRKRVSRGLRTLRRDLRRSA